MQVGATLEKQQKYDDALNAYKSALKLMPGDVKATVGVHMAGGRKAQPGSPISSATSATQIPPTFIPGTRASTSVKRAKSCRMIGTAIIEDFRSAAQRN